MTFAGKTAIITGASSGIGRATALALIKRGSSVVLNGRRANVLEGTARELDPTLEKVAFFAGDIGKKETGRQLAELAKRRFGGADLLINAAGIFAPKPFVEHQPADLDAYVDTILKGTFYASQAAVPLFRAKGGGAIVNVGSMWAIEAIGATPSSAYSAAKAGVHMLTRNLAIELAADHIRVNTVAPAVVETPVYATFLPKDQVRAVLDSFNAFHPLGRNGQPEDLVNAILFLASDEASWITGTVLPVDGGVTAGRHR